jgi:threonylcarbamoyladenosine tRNA methylthiotransferase MtaB
VVRFSVVTFGCRVNQADTQRVEEALRARGASESAPEHADLLVVNTCSVTASSDQAVRQTIRRIVRSNPAVRVVVTGCYATRRPDDASQLPNVVRVVSNTEKDELGTLLADEAAPSTAERYDGDDGCGLTASPVRSRTALTLRVQTGCDEHCTYCIIPSTRGPGRSRPLASVCADISRAVESGFREIVVAGVHLGSYGRDFADGTTLEHLVARLADWPADVRFRISSLEPMECSPTLVRLCASSSRVAPHFHLPLQHGSDRMLRVMGRPYSVAAYGALVRDLHAQIPQVSIGTDLIVGFPDETDDDARQLADLVETLPLSYLHVFPYSDRPGTVAAAMGSKVPGTVVRERARRLRDIGVAKAAAFRAGQTGVRHRALVLEDGWTGVTGNYLKVRFDRQLARNQWAEVEVVDGASLDARVLGAW